MEPIQKALELSETLSGLRPLDMEKEAIIMQKFRLDWNYNSNNLEGNSLTFGETKALILFGITAQGKPLKDHFEITGHDEAIKWVTELVSGDYPLTENFVRELHQLLLKESYEVKAITPDGQPTRRRIGVGQYKTAPNHVQTKTGEVFRFATPEETPAKMHDLVDWYRTKSNEPDGNAIILAAEFHYRFIRIHPFDDGNGRTARILMNFILMKFGYPPVIIKTEDKENYFAALRQADAGMIEPFIDYIATNLIRSLEIMISGAKGEPIEEPDDVDKQIALLEQRLKAERAKPPQKGTKSKEVLYEMYDKSIQPLLHQFKIECNKFDKFYRNTLFLVTEVNGIMLLGRFGDNIKNRLDEYFKGFIIVCQYEAFNIAKYGFFDNRSTIRFQFKLVDGYSIDFAGQTLEKKYGEQLSDEEIDTIVKTLSKAHAAFIEEKLKEV